MIVTNDGRNMQESGNLGNSTVTVQVEAMKQHNSAIDIGETNSLRMSGHNIVSGPIAG